MKKRNLEYKTYLDKVLGGWLGKSIGGTVGCPYESHKIFGRITVDNCWPAYIAPNDDLDIQVVWLEALEDGGPGITRDYMAKYWQDHCWYNFSEYGYFLYNIQRGIHTPLSGRYNNTWFSESEGCPIRAEIWGMVTPGDINLAAKYAQMDGELDHIDNSVWAEQFHAAAIAESFFTDDLDAILEAGRKVIPEDSDIYRISLDVPKLWREENNLKPVWKRLIRKYGHRDSSKCQINFAFTILSLYAGNYDLMETVVTAVNCGWDSDCTAATAGALVGTIIGAEAIPDEWKNRLGDKLSCDVAVRHKIAPMADFAADTCKVGLEITYGDGAKTEILNVPVEIAAEVMKRKNSRPAPAVIEFETVYKEGPALYAGRTTEVILKIHYSGPRLATGCLSAAAPDGIDISPDKLSLCLIPGGSQEIVFHISADPDKKIMWDKNLIDVKWSGENGGNTEYTFGVCGSRQWLAYGPYWDAWDTDKFGHDICPYRNESVTKNPVLVEGCGQLEFHEYVNHDNEYLDEARLLKEDIADEDPYIIERGEDIITEEHLGGFTGEACYYLVREIWSSAPIDECAVFISASGPFTVWVDGIQVIKEEKPDAWMAWAPMNNSFITSFDDKPKRIVIKCIRLDDIFRLNMWVMTTNIYGIGDHIRGVSYMLDSTGDTIKRLE